MRDLLQLDAATALGIKALLTDIDDTVTSDGALTAEAYAALASLDAHGLAVIPVTGRPAGWCDMIARFWPVKAVVGENGAFWFSYDHARRRMKRWYFASDEERAENRRRLDAIRDEVLARVPGSAVSADQAYRVADLAIDFREDVVPLPEEAVARIVDIFRAAGAEAKISSIHVNGWFGRYDKLSTALKLLQDEFGMIPDVARAAVMFVGDSPNDEPMFGFFPLSVGVANVQDALHLIASKPAFVTSKRSGEGFVELAARLVTLQDRT
jgi:HAD superfamily hydrolase (TIGR01484 family)